MVRHAVLRPFGASGTIGARETNVIVDVAALEEIALWCAAGVALLVGIFAAQRILGRRSQPKVSERPAEDDTPAPTERPVPTAGRSREWNACRGTLDLARDASRLARERPDVAQSILRLWLAEDRDAKVDSGRPVATPALDPALDTSIELVADPEEADVVVRSSR